MNDLQTLIVSILAGVIILLLFYIVRFLRTIAVNGADQQVERSQGNGRKGSTGNAKAEVDILKSSPRFKYNYTTIFQTQKPTQPKAAPSKKVKNHHRQQTSVSFSHPWLLTSLKGHSGPVLDMDFSSNGKFLASCSTDRSILVWPTKLFNSKTHNPIRGNIAFDEADKIKWSPDSKAFLLHKAVADELEVYKLNKRPDGDGYTVSSGSLDFPVKHSDCSEMVSIDMASNGKFIMSCSSTTDLVLYDLKGQILHKLDTCLMKTYCGKISPDGRFVAASGFTPDVKLWEVKLSKSGDLEKVKRAFELTGHSSGIWQFAFNADSSRVATVSRDGTWKVYGTNIEFDRGQDPTVISSGQHGF